MQARRAPFDQPGFQFPLERRELPRYGRMVHAQTPSRPENLTGAGNLKEYADAIPNPSTLIFAQRTEDSSH